MSPVGNRNPGIKMRLRLRFHAFRLSSDSELVKEVNGLSRGVYLLTSEVLPPRVSYQLDNPRHSDLNIRSFMFVFIYLTKYKPYACGSNVRCHNVRVLRMCVK